MYPPARSLDLDVSAISSILGSMSIACWLVVFLPQIWVNFQRKSAEAVSTTFLVIWLVGDVFNIAGAVLQGVLPTMIILAVWYTFADILLVAQVTWYQKWHSGTDRSNSATEIGTGSEPALEERASEASKSTLEHDDSTSQTDTSVRRDPQQSEPASQPTERTPLLSLDPVSLNPGAIISPADSNAGASQSSQTLVNTRSRRSLSTIREQESVSNAAHLSPIVPIHHPTTGLTPSIASLERRRTERNQYAELAKSIPQARREAFLKNAGCLLLVCATGVVGWWLSSRSSVRQPHHGLTDKDREMELQLDFQAQIYGYVCAVLYLVSRVPQLYTNWKRQKTEGLSMMFFLFASIGNLTYVLSIMAFDPAPFCSHRRCREGEPASIYGKHVLVNLSWLLGSAGTLLLDLGVFAQFFIYREKIPEIPEIEDDDSRGSGETILAHIYTGGPPPAENQEEHQEEHQAEH
ncbi:MAG: hypothetical protein M1820_006236 [Bogoriella megaspora]|nr:MAG: hypothetical protein M1820_006236 [Bogoriella megaspora]